MKQIWYNEEFKGIIDKVYDEERLTREDGLRLIQSNDILLLGHLADIVRQRKAGNNVYFSRSININHTNICEVRCRFCAFSKDIKDPRAYTMSLDEIENKVKNVVEKEGMIEVHIVGGLNPKLELEYFCEMLKRIKKINNKIHIQGFTAAEIDYFAKKANKSVKEILVALKQSGLGTLPGGGAEIFSQNVRTDICPDKISGQRWLEIMEQAHNVGMRSNATMLYGHIESHQDIIEHILSLRELQDNTNGFFSFVPLAFHYKNTSIDVKHFTTGWEDVKILAISRLLLDNFEHIKALWMTIGLKMAQIMLHFGADDLGGTSVDEKIVHAAGAKTPNLVTPKQLEKIIIEAGRVPVEVDSRYQPQLLKDYDNANIK